MGEEELCNLVLEATGKSEKELPKARILALSRLALQKLADKDAQSPNQSYRQLLRFAFTVTVTSGIGDLSTIKAAAEPILADEIYSAEVYFSGIARRGQALPDRAALSLDRLRNFPYFTIAADQMIVRYNGTDPTTTATITGNRVPTLANLPGQMKDELTLTVAEMAIGAQAQAA